MFRINFLFVLLCVFSIGRTSAQSDSIVIQKKRNTAYIELLGNTAVRISLREVFTLNYDCILTKGISHNFSIRIGGNYGGASSPSSVGILLNYLYGIKNNHLELGLGYVNIMDTDSPVFHQPVKSISEDRLTASFSYRYQQPKGGLFFKGGWTPVLRFELEDFYPYKALALMRIGLSAGYSF